jgi:hypothetical protein
MILFNAFQIVASFVGWPYLIFFLHDAAFRGAGVAFYSACALYVVAFATMVASVANSLDTWKW